LDEWSAHRKASANCPGWLWWKRSWWNKTLFGRGTEVLGDNLPRRHFVHHKSHLPDPDANPGRRSGKPAINRFSYGAAIENLPNVTTSNYSATGKLHTLQSTTACTKSSQYVVSSQVDVPLLPGLRPRRLAAISHQPPTLLTAVSRFLCNGSWSSLCSPGFQQSLHCCVLHSRYLVMEVSLAPQFLLWANMAQYQGIMHYKSKQLSLSAFRLPQTIQKQLLGKRKIWPLEIMNTMWCVSARQPVRPLGSTERHAPHFVVTGDDKTTKTFFFYCFRSSAEK
jgi:hypothetical protein